MADVETERDGAVTIIRINRPARLNAIAASTARALQAAFEDFDRSDARAAVIGAAGDRAFTAGADIADPPELWRCIPGVGFVTGKPIVAAVGGWCVGGGLVMSMMCDLLVAAENTRFLYPEAKLGLSGGIISGLVSRMPHKLAMELILLGAEMSARRGYEVGFVNRVVADGTQEREAVAIAHLLAAQAPLVVSTLKRLVDEVLPVGPVAAMVKTQQALARIADSADKREGLAAHREKRPPRFKGA